MVLTGFHETVYKLLHVTSSSQSLVRVDDTSHYAVSQLQKQKLDKDQDQRPAPHPHPQEQHAAQKWPLSPFPNSWETQVQVGPLPLLGLQQGSAKSISPSLGSGGPSPVGPAGGTGLNLPGIHPVLKGSEVPRIPTIL